MEFRDSHRMTTFLVITNMFTAISVHANLFQHNISLYPTPNATFQPSIPWHSHSSTISPSTLPTALPTLKPTKRLSTLPTSLVQISHKPTTTRITLKSMQPTISKTLYHTSSSISPTIKPTLERKNSVSTFISSVSSSSNGGVRIIPIYGWVILASVVGLILFTLAFFKRQQKLPLTRINEVDSINSDLTNNSLDLEDQITLSSFTMDTNKDIVQDEDESECYQSSNSSIHSNRILTSQR